MVQQEGYKINRDSKTLRTLHEETKYIILMNYETRKEQNDKETEGQIDKTTVEF